jgi:ribosomal protein S18 acetylase RimI-like enzyme
MTDSVEFRINAATAAQIADHLAKADDAFIPPLSDRVEINDYAKRIADRAERFEAWAGGILVGLVAAYCNDTANRTAYVTSVSVIPEYQRRGIATRLVDACIAFAKDRQFRRVALEVDQDNQPAVELYEAHGFRVVGMNGRTIDMLLDTRKDMGMDNRS